MQNKNQSEEVKQWRGRKRWVLGAGNIGNSGMTFLYIENDWHTWKEDNTMGKY